MRLVFVFWLLLMGTLGMAQGEGKDAAIALAAESPALSGLLSSHPGWTADAYKTGTSYGIWRVQFFFSSGAELGWADVSPKLAKLFAWEADYQLTGKQNAHAERTLYRFVRNDPEIRALVGDTEKLDKWFWYDSWREGWFVHLESGPDSLDVSIRSRFKGPLKLSKLFVEKIYLSNVLSYAEYQEASRSSAVALAFAEPEIAAALRDKPGWASSAEPSGQEWKIRFSLGETLVATAVVDLNTQQIRSFEVSP